ncbi:SH3 domain-containing protein [Methyloceanibacter methanicus]|uniref:SH3 domain-containing protein n=1 Tax=Methyloceanibacter methanicus TaxID=1774968 RepID=UPI0009F71D43|nr:SH3 domain-containing protein [Methyloceanibacter methanicus]
MGFRGTARLGTALALAVSALLAGAVLFATPAHVVAEEAVIPVAANGKSSGLRVPRFVSLKSNKVNVRRGPSTDQAIVWVFSRAGLPVEVIAEFENWRRVRDSEGADGWVFHSLLSGRRTVLVSPWSKAGQGAPVSIPLHERRSAGSGVVAQLQPGVIGDLVACDGQWCELSVGSYSGYVQQQKLWGVYRDEKIE